MSARRRILDALAGHEPVDEAERESLERVVSYVGSAKAPMDRSDPFGHVVASGLPVGPGLDRLVLLHHRQLGMWLQPGGHAEPDESDPYVVAEREAREETRLGLEAHPSEPELVDVDAHRIPATDAMPEHWHFDLRYLFQADPGQQPQAPDEEAREVRWFDVDEALAELELDAGLRRLLGKVRELR